MISYEMPFTSETFKNIDKTTKMSNFLQSIILNAEVYKEEAQTEISVSKSPYCLCRSFGAT